MREPISSARQAVGTSSGGLCEINPPLGPRASANYLYANNQECSAEFSFGKLTSEFLALLTCPLQGPDWEYCLAMGPVANKHLGVRTKRNYILVLLLYLLKWGHDSVFPNNNGTLQHGWRKPRHFFGIRSRFVVGGYESVQ